MRPRAMRLRYPRRNRCSNIPRVALKCRPSRNRLVCNTCRGRLRCAAGTGMVTPGPGVPHGGALGQFQSLSTAGFLWSPFDFFRSGHGAFQNFVYNTSMAVHELLSLHVIDTNIISHLPSPPSTAQSPLPTIITAIPIIPCPSRITCILSSPSSAQHPLPNHHHPYPHTATPAAHACHSPLSAALTVSPAPPLSPSSAHRAPPSTIVTIICTASPV